MDIALTIEKLVGLGVKYGGCTEFNIESEFNDLKWNDERKKPTWKELVTKWEEIKDLPEPKSNEELLQEKLEKLEARIAELEAKTATPTEN